MNKYTLAVITGALLASQYVSAQTSTTPTEPAKTATTWADKTSIKGDVRLRFEQIDAEGKDERERFRVRGRIGAISKVTTELETGIQLSTSEANDPVSGNQTLGQGGSRKDVYFDLIYLDYHPEAVPGLRAIGGKMEVPFVRVSDLVYDNDYNPEGLAVRYKAGDSVQFLLNGASIFLEERAEDDESSLYAGQVALKFQNEEASYVQAGVSLYQFDGMKGFAPLFDPAKGAKGNSTTKEVTDAGKTNLLYANDFEIPEVFFEAWMNTGIPVGFYGNYAVNNDVDDEDTAFLVGLKLGKSKDPGSFDFDYNYREVEKDSVVGQLTDSDSFGGGTDGEGHRVSLGYQIAKNLKGVITYFMNKSAVSKGELDYDRLQVDFSGKF